ncbi:hypothetical protein OAQ84_01825 [Bdellovibrionales bacterium]|nr:hypothetical protein [Bdellovibrionales bacterium]
MTAVGNTISVNMVLQTRFIVFPMKVNKVAFYARRTCIILRLYFLFGGNWGELRIDFGPGYRVYFGVYEDELVLLLHGGTKKNQQEDIELAEERWERYLKNKKENTDGK